MTQIHIRMYKEKWLDDSQQKEFFVIEVEGECLETPLTDPTSLQDLAIWFHDQYCPTVKPKAIVIYEAVISFSPPEGQDYSLHARPDGAFHRFLLSHLSKGDIEKFDRYVGERHKDYRSHINIQRSHGGLHTIKSTGFLVKQDES